MLGMAGLNYMQESGYYFYPYERNKKNPESESARNLTLDEEAAHAEAQLDAMYLREHGEPPQKPNKDPHAEDTNASE